jgi:membrane protein DedA with SNARE-associated domain
MMVLASVSDSLVNVAVHVIRDLGLPGIFLLMACDATAIPFPSEATMMFAGFNVFQGHHTILEVVVAGALGDVVGSCIAYGIGYYGRRELLETHGAKLHITPQRLALAERWFEKHGSLTIAIGRNVPVLRAFFSFPAGVARMPFGRFALMTLIGVIPWVLAWSLFGHAVGSKWNSWRHHLAYLDYAVLVLLVIGVVYLLIRRRRRGAEARPAPDATS